MKSLSYIIVFLFLFPNLFFAQDQKKAESNSKAVTFSLREGTLIQKEFYPLGTLKGGTSFDAVVFTDRNTNEKTGGLLIKTTYRSSMYGDAEYIGMIDQDEISGCLSAMRALQDSVITSAPFAYTECDVNTRDGVLIRVFYDNKKGWQGLIQAKRDYPDSAKQIDMKELALLIQYLNDSRIIIDEQIKDQ